MVKIDKDELTQILSKDYYLSLNQMCLVVRSKHQEVRDWSVQCGITISYLGSVYSVYDVWQILKEDHMMWFRLRWE